MKRFSIFSAALLAVAAFVSASFAFEPGVSLNYEGKYLGTDALTVEQTDAGNGAVDWTFVTPDKKVAICVSAQAEEGYPATRMTARIRNLSDSEETGLVSELRIFAKKFELPNKDGDVTVNALVGTSCNPHDFEPNETVLHPYDEKIFEAPSGRCANEWAPYLEASVGERDGWLFCIGWTGCWRARFVNNGDSLGVQLGMMRTGFKLRPGESLLQPTVLFFERSNMTRAEFKTLVHRYTVEKNSPRDSEGALWKPIVALTAGGGNKTPQMMLDVLNYGLKNDLPFDVFWVDAGWYGPPHEDEHYSNCGPNWYRYVGDWIVNTTTHPTGDLLPIANAVHAADKRFLLWFEPERVHPETELAKKAPFDKQHGMCWYGNPESLDYMEKTIFGIIEKHHIDVYRQDFNMHPTASWAAIEEDEGPDRVGVAEAKHIEGLYKFLDDMRAKFPWIMQENCAGGGTRVDIEMVKRAHSYCRSDYFIGPKEGDTAFNLGQNMTLNLSPYLPFQGGETNCVPNFDDYGFMSVASSGTVFTPTDLDGGIVKREFSAEETAWFKKMLGWARRLQPYYMGDFYQLTPETGVTDDCWCAWSCDLPETNEGFVIAFRRAKAEEASKTFALPAIDPNAKYSVEYYDGTKVETDGAALKELAVTLAAPRSFAILIYKKL